MQISKAEFGKHWCFTLRSGVLRWKLSKQLMSDRVTLIPYLLFDGDDSKTYALNGLARASALYHDYETIWRDNPERKGAKVPVTQVMALGLRLLEQQHPTIYQSIMKPPELLTG